MVGSIDQKALPDSFYRFEVSRLFTYCLDGNYFYRDLAFGIPAAHRPSGQPPWNVFLSSDWWIHRTGEPLLMQSQNSAYHFDFP